MSRRGGGGGGGGGAAPVGDPYVASELVPGVVVFMDPDRIGKFMRDQTEADDDPLAGGRAFSCDPRRAVNMFHNFLCVHRFESSGRTLWAPIQKRPDDDRVTIPMDQITGTRSFKEGTHNVHPDQLWVATDECVNDAAFGGARKDESKSGQRNRVNPQFMPLEQFSTSAKKWTKTVERPKKAAAAKEVRDPTNGNALFRDWDPKELGRQDATRAREQKEIRQQIAMTYPELPEDVFNDPTTSKPVDIMQVPTSNNTNLIVRLGKQHEIIFFQHNYGPWLPTLRVLHIYPWMMPSHQVDIGGCKFVLGGADVMSPGTLTPGGRLHDGLGVGKPVAIHIEGKKHAASVGVTLMSSKQVRETKRGPCVQNVHFLGDGLWKHTVLKAVEEED
jgi:PUA domain protein